MPNRPDTEAIAARARKTREIAAAFPGSDKAASLAQLANDLDTLLAALATADYAIDHHWTRGQLQWACDELAKHGLTPCAANFDWLAAVGHKATGPQADAHIDAELLRVHAEGFGNGGPAPGATGEAS